MSPVIRAVIPYALGAVFCGWFIYCGAQKIITANRHAGPCVIAVNDYGDERFALERECRSHIRNEGWMIVAFGTFFLTLIALGSRHAIAASRHTG